MWNYYKDEKLTKQITEGTSQTTGQSVLTSRDNCMGSQAVCILVVFRPFVLVIVVLFIAVLHGNALHPSFPH